MSPSLADDHSPPRTRLEVAGESAAGISSIPDEWIRRDGELCGHGVADGFIGFRRNALEVPSGSHQARARIFKSQRPDEVVVKAWEAVDAEGRPVGGVDRYKRRLISFSRNGETVAWEVWFKPSVEDHLYIHLTGRWRDQEGCGGMQKASWTFHLRTA